MAAAQGKVIITCAVTGSIHTPSMSPHLPITADEITEQSIAAAEAGAAILHLHARDPKDGRALAFGRGLTWALELESEDRARLVLERAREQGLRLTRGLPGRVMVLPPVNVQDAEIDEGMRRLSRVLEGL